MKSAAQPRIAAHLIIGKRDEPFLPALLASIAPFTDTLIVNDNSASADSLNRKALLDSPPAREGRLVLDETPFTDFAAARNICLARHREQNAGEWVAFIDADEVHGERSRGIAARLGRVPESIGRIDGYTMHFFQSFDWYASIERRLSFFRFSPDLVWRGAVHEQLMNIRGGALPLPYLYAHYGHVFSVERHAEKESQYQQLGVKGARATLEELTSADPLTYFADTWRSLMPFRGRHPLAARATIERMRTEFAAQFVNNEAIIRRRRGTALDALRRTYWHINYDIRWRSRVLSPLAATLVTS